MQYSKVSHERRKGLDKSKLTDRIKNTRTVGAGILTLEIAGVLQKCQIALPDASKLYTSRERNGKYGGDDGSSSQQL